MSDRIYKMVEQAMENAAENGYGPELYNLSDAELASDLQGCDTDLEGEHIADILAAVRKWRDDGLERPSRPVSGPDPV